MDLSFPPAFFSNSIWYFPFFPNVLKFPHPLSRNENIVILYYSKSVKFVAIIPLGSASSILLSSLFLKFLLGLYWSCLIYCLIFHRSIFLSAISCIIFIYIINLVLAQFISLMVTFFHFQISIWLCLICSCIWFIYIILLHVILFALWISFLCLFPRVLKLLNKFEYIYK